MSQPDAIFRLYEQRGHERYGEHVTQLQHALQCAAQAEAEGARAALVLAAFLHDVGHLLHRDAGAAFAARRDDRHERLGAAALARAFGPDVVRPVALHVEAKRWLCAREPGYWDLLSDASKTTLEMQGGPMDAAAARAFEADPHAEDAVRLRRWDEAAKDPAGPSEGWERFRVLAEDMRLGRAPGA